MENTLIVNKSAERIERRLKALGVEGISELEIPWGRHIFSMELAGEIPFRSQDHLIFADRIERQLDSLGSKGISALENPFVRHFFAVALAHMIPKPFVSKDGKIPFRD